MGRACWTRRWRSHERQVLNEFYANARKKFRPPSRRAMRAIVRRYQHWNPCRRQATWRRHGRSKRTLQLLGPRWSSLPPSAGSAILSRKTCTRAAGSTASRYSTLQSALRSRRRPALSDLDASSIMTVTCADRRPASCRAMSRAMHGYASSECRPRQGRHRWENPFAAARAGAESRTARGGRANRYPAGRRAAAECEHGRCGDATSWGGWNDVPDRAEACSRSYSARPPLPDVMSQSPHLPCFASSAAARAALGRMRSARTSRAVRRARGAARAAAERVLHRVDLTSRPRLERVAVHAWTSARRTRSFDREGDSHD